MCATTRPHEFRCAGSGPLQTGLAACLGPAPTQSPFPMDHSPSWWSFSVVFVVIRPDARLHDTIRTGLLRNFRGPLNAPSQVAVTQTGARFAHPQAPPSLPKGCIRVLSVGAVLSGSCVFGEPTQPFPLVQPNPHLCVLYSRA